MNNMASRRVCFSVGDEFVGRVDRWSDHDLDTLYDRMIRIKAQSAVAIEIIEAEFRARLDATTQTIGEAAVELVDSNQQAGEPINV